MELGKLMGIFEFQRNFWLERGWDFQLIEDSRPIGSRPKLYNQHLCGKESLIIIQPKKVCERSSSLTVQSSYAADETLPTKNTLKLYQLMITDKDVEPFQQFKLRELHLEQCSLKSSIDFGNFRTLKRLRITLKQDTDCRVELPPNLRVLFVYCFPSKKRVIRVTFNAQNCSSLRIM